MYIVPCFSLFKNDLLIELSYKERGMSMNGFSVFMFIFGFLLYAAGIYIYTGHNSELLIWKGYNKNATKEELKVVGKWVIIVGTIPILLGILGLMSIISG